MLAAIVRGSLAHPRIVTALSLLIALLGAAALLEARLDVFPDFAPPHVLVQAEAPGLDATQVEVAGHPAAGGSARRSGERRGGALDLQSGTVGDPGGVRP